MLLAIPIALRNVYNNIFSMYVFVYYSHNMFKLYLRWYLIRT